MQTLLGSLLLILALSHLSGCEAREAEPVKPPVQRPTETAVFAEAQPRDTSRRVLERYLTARLNGNWREAYTLTATTVTESAYIEEAERRAPLAPVIGEACTFEMVEFTTEGTKAKAKVMVRMPDLSPFIQKLIMQGIKADLLGQLESYEPILEELKLALESGDFTQVTQTQSFALIQREDGWKLDARGASTPQ